MQTDVTTPNNVIWSCCVRFHVAKSLNGFKLWATTPKNTQQRAIGPCERTQHVTTNNVGSCWPTMFSSVCKGHTVRAKMEAVVSRENPEKQTRDNENAFF